MLLFDACSADDGLTCLTRRVSCTLAFETERSMSGLVDGLALEIICPGTTELSGRRPWP